MDYFQRYVKACLDSLAKAGRYIWEVGQPCQSRKVHMGGGAALPRQECTMGGWGNVTEVGMYVWVGWGNFTEVGMYVWVGWDNVTEGFVLPEKG